LRVALGLLVTISGCGSDPTAYDPSRLSFDPGAGWTKAEPSSVLAPGRVISAWTGPEGSSLALVRTLPVPRGEAINLKMDFASRLDNNPELVFQKQETTTVGGQSAAWVEVVAPGNGSSLAPTGLGKPSVAPGETLVPTRRVSVGFNRPDAVYWLVAHYPEKARSTIGPAIEGVLRKIAFKS
jgi:hypothetical protein